MGNIAEKLQNIIDSKAAISAAIEAKGGTVPTELTGYGAAIEALPSGGGSQIFTDYMTGTLTSITASDLSGVTSIRDNAFYGFAGLKSAEMPTTVNSFGTHVFHNCTGLTSVTLPTNLTTIPTGTFTYCSNLKSYTIPEGITTIGNEAFRYSGLSSLVMPSSLTALGNNAFGYCSNMKSVDSWGGLTSLTSNAFSYAGLSSVELPNGMVTTGTYSFSYCSSLSSVTIPPSLTSFGQDTFLQCNKLTAVNISDLSAWCGITFIGGQSNPVFWSKKLILNGEELTSIVVPDGITQLKNFVFANNQELTSIIIPASVTSIGNYAFNQTTNCLVFDFSAATSIPTLTGVNAFEGSNANKKIIVPDDLYDSWKAANNWKSTTNGIVDAITKASEA